MSRLRGICVGAGEYSRFHLEAWQRVERAEIVAICDLDAERAASLADQFGIVSSGNNLGRMLDELSADFVDIVTPPPLHLGLVGEVAERGIDLVCQEPLAPTWQEAREIVVNAARADVRLMVQQKLRFQPWHREIQHLIQTGAIGDRLHTLTVRSRQGGGFSADTYRDCQPSVCSTRHLLTYETAVHFVDIFRFLGGEIDGVYAVLRRFNPFIRGEDCALVLFEFASGTLGVWDANRYNEANGPDPGLTFGEFLIEGNGGSLRLYLDGRLTIQPLGQVKRNHDYVWQRRGFAGDCVFFALQHFIACLESGDRFETEGVDYLRALAIQEAIYESARRREPVRGIPISESDLLARDPALA